MSIANHKPGEAMNLGATDVELRDNSDADSLARGIDPPHSPKLHLPGDRSTAYVVTVWTARVGILVAFFGAWQRLGSSSAYWELFVTKPTRIASEMWSWFGEGAFWNDLRATLTAAGLGYIAGVIAAIIAVGLVAPFPVVGRLVRPFIAASNALPKVALAPLFLFWFGIGIGSKVYFVASFIFFIVFYGVYTAVKSINLDLLDNTRVLGASKPQMVRHVYLPAMATWVISSLRIGIPFSILAAVFSEYLGGSAGVGVRIAIGQQMLRNHQVMAGVFILATIALVLDRVLVRAEGHLGRWKTT